MAELIPAAASRVVAVGQKICESKPEKNSPPPNSPPPNSPPPNSPPPNSPPPLAVSEIERQEMLPTIQETTDAAELNLGPGGHPHRKKRKPKSMSARAKEAEAARRYRKRKNQDFDALQNALKSAEARAAAAEARAAAAEEAIVVLHGKARDLVATLRPALDGIQAAEYGEEAAALHHPVWSNGIHRVHQAADEGADGTVPDELFKELLGTDTPPTAEGFGDDMHTKLKLDDFF